MCINLLSEQFPRVNRKFGEYIISGSDGYVRYKPCLES